MKYAIEINGLKKRYGTHDVLKGLDFHVVRGEIFALLGANGAGKTTALECIEGLRSYDGGRITLHGKMGIQLQSASLPAHIRVREAVRLFAAWNHTEPAPGMLSALGLDGLSRRQYRELSTGQKRRLHLALALIGNPDILFLDEPTAGLDVEARASLHEQIRLLREQGKTILLTSHDMAEVENLCDHIAILRNGVAAFSGTVPELNEKLGKHYNITIRTNLGMHQLESDDVAGTLLSLLQHCRESRAVISDLHVDRGSLEQHFIQIAKGE